MILITGATGFLGKYLVDEMLAVGYDVRVLVRNAQGRNLPWKEMVEIVEGDILEVGTLIEAFKGVTHVIHAAAVVSFWKKRWEEMMEVNVVGTQNIVDACLEAKVEKLVHISSVAALGRNTTKGPIDDQAPWKPHKLNSKYSVSKHKAELEVHRGIAEGLDAVMVNPGVILGASDNWQANTPKIYSIVDKGLKFYNPGVFGVVAADDVAKATRLVLESTYESGERFVLVSENMSQHELLQSVAQSLNKRPPKRKVWPIISLTAGFISEKMANLSGKEPVITYESMRGSIQQHHYDGSKITQLGMDYTPIQEVIAATGQAYLKQHNPT